MGHRAQTCTLDRWRGGARWEEEGGTIPSPPTFIGQDLADMDGEVFGVEDGEGRGGGGPLKRRLGSS